MMSLSKDLPNDWILSQLARTSLLRLDSVTLSSIVAYCQARTVLIQTLLNEDEFDKNLNSDRRKAIKRELLVLERLKVNSIKILVRIDNTLMSSAITAGTTGGRRSNDT